MRQKRILRVVSLIGVNRSRLEGGGFGLTGAVKGIAVAETVNLAFGAAHMVFNGLGELGSSISASNKKNRSFTIPKRTAISLMQKLLLLLFNLQAEFDKLAFPVFRLGQFSDFRTTKPQFQTENMLVNSDIMSLLEFIGFIISRKSTAFRRILNRP